MTRAQRRWRSRGVVGLGAVLALAVGSLAAPARADTPAALPAAGPACPTAVPLASVRAGMTGDGLTVVRGTSPERFGAEVLGVLHDFNGPGHDLIVVELRDIDGGHVIDQAGEGWQGMSGSPVYVGGQLLGAFSYGLAWGPSRIGGLTPAGEMLDVLARGPQAAAQPAQPAEVELPKALRRSLQTAASAPVPATLRRMPLPLMVGGLAPQRLTRLQRTLDAASLPLAVHASSRAAATQDEAVPAPEPGGNFSVGMSYGDVTMGGIGTTTLVCGQHVLAFGHPMNLAGAVAYGAGGATSLGIVADPTGGSYKLAEMTAPFGTLDQDRIAGVRATLGRVPTGARVTTTVRDSGTGAKRIGTTISMAPEMLPEIGGDAVLSNYDTVFDEIGDGRATSHWTIRGTRAGGKALVVHRDNRWASREDIALEPASELASALDALTSTDDEPVTITTVDLDSTVNTAFRQLRVATMAVQVNGKGKWVSPEELKVKAGAKLNVRVTMKAFRSTATTTATATLTVPKNAAGQTGTLSAVGGVDLNDPGDRDDEDAGCLVDDSACGGDAELTLNQVIKGLTTAPQNDDVRVGLALESERTGKASPAQTVTRRQGATVTGGADIEITVTR